MKYLLQYKFPGCGDWFMVHEAETYSEVHGYYTDNPDEFVGLKVRIVKVVPTVLAELQ